MDKSRPTFVLDYVDTAFNEVCDLLSGWEHERLTTGTDRRPSLHVGPVDRIADHVVRIRILDDDDDVAAEVRVLAVSTGREPITELLVVARPTDASACGRATVVARARSILRDATRRIESSARHALTTRAN